MKEQIQLVVVISTITILVWIWIVAPLYRMIKSRFKTKSVSSGSENTIQNKENEEVEIVAVGLRPKSISENYFAVANKVTVFMREKHDAGISCADAIQGALNQFSSGINKDSVLEYVAKAGYPAEDLAEVMAKWNYSPWDVRERLSDDYNLFSLGIAKIIIKIFPKSTDREKIEMIFSAFEDDEVENLIPVCSEIFGSDVPSTLVGEMLLQECDMRLGDVVLNLNLKDNISVIVEIATNAQVDITDSDEYSGFRGNDYFSFEYMSIILARMGKDAKTILETEQEYDEFDFYSKSDRDSIFISLRSCGFGDKQIIEAVNSIDIPLGKLVFLAVESNVSVEDIVDYLRPEWGNHFEDLWAELEDDVEFSDAVEIMYALIPTENRKWNK